MKYRNQVDMSFSIQRVVHRLFAAEMCHGSSCPKRWLPSVARNAAPVEEEGIVLEDVRSGRDAVDGHRGGLLQGLGHSLADQRREVRVLGVQVGDRRLRPGQLSLEFAHLILELEYDAGAPVHRVPHPGIRLVRHAARRVLPLPLRDFLSMRRSVSKSEERVQLGGINSNTIASWLSTIYSRQRCNRCTVNLEVDVLTCKSLVMLPAPKTRCAFVKVRRSVGGK